MAHMSLMPNRFTSILILFLMMQPALAGCFGTEEVSVVIVDEGYPSVWDRYNITYKMDDDFIRVTENGS